MLVVYYFVVIIKQSEWLSPVGCCLHGSILRDILKIFPCIIVRTDFSVRFVFIKTGGALTLANRKFSLTRKFVATSSE